MKAMVVIFVVSILIAVVLVLTGYKPLTGYGPPPTPGTCGSDGQEPCEERGR